MSRISKALVIIAAIMTAAGCDFIAGGYLAPDGHAAFVEIQEGGSLASQCVVDLVTTPYGNAHDVAAAIAQPPNAALVIAGWSLPGLDRQLTYQDCAITWAQTVEPWLVAHGDQQYCRLTPNIYDLC